MQLVRSRFFDKTNDSLSSAVKAVRNTSCSRGWLRLVVHCFFGALTVSSFILIVLMSVGSPLPRKTESRCSVNGCGVVCHKAPYFGDFEDDILVAAAEAEEKCNGVSLLLDQPSFRNSTMPSRWLHRLRSKVHTLEIVGGNLRQLSSQAFMTHLGEEIRTLSLENITIVGWVSGTLLGLIHLETLRVGHSTLSGIYSNALEAVDDTLENLIIEACGTWVPTNITGSSNFVKLAVVEFPNNKFPILRNTSLVKLHTCKVLYLDYCHISAIEEGTFDNLRSLEVIYLDNNCLKVITPGLFNTLLSLFDPVPRIGIHDNYWHCDCSNYDLRELYRRDMILVDTKCYSPENFRGTSFTDFEYYCQNYDDSGSQQNFLKNGTTADYVYETKSDKTTTIHLNGKCQRNNNSVYTTFSSLNRLKCSSQIKLNPNESTENHESKLGNKITPNFAIGSSERAVVQISSSGSSQYGLVWYQSQCPEEIYCVNVLPNFLRIYNINISTKYTFCPMYLSSGNVQSENCIDYAVDEIDATSLAVRIIIYVIVAMFFLAFGASCLYAIILKFPALLRGSKRILFVKHKNVDALILPPKVPLRTVLSNEPLSGFNDKEIFLLPNPEARHDCLRVNVTGFLSRRSSKSVAPSYISALQPTEAELADWRLRHHFTGSTDYGTSTNLSSFIGLDENGPYESICTDRVYESLKSEY